MVRVTPLQRCSNLELAEGMGRVIVLGMNSGRKNRLDGFCADVMIYEGDRRWLSLIEDKFFIAGEGGWEPFAFADITFPSDLDEFYEMCKREQEAKKNE